MKEQVEEILNQQIQLIEKKLKTIKAIEESPLLILTELFNHKHQRPYYETPFYLLGADNTQNYHAFQNYLMELVKPIIKKTNSDIKIALVEENRYPSSIKVLLHEKELLHFDFYRHTYKSILKWKKEQLEKRIEETKIDLYELQELRDHFKKELEKPKSIFLKLKEKFFSSPLEDKINLYNKKISNKMQRLNDLIKQEVDFEEEFNALSPLHDQLISLFKKIGYQEEH